MKEKRQALKMWTMVEKGGRRESERGQLGGPTSLREKPRKSCSKKT